MDKSCNNIEKYFEKKDIVLETEYKMSLRIGITSENVVIKLKDAKNGMPLAVAIGCIIHYRDGKLTGNEERVLEYNEAKKENLVIDSLRREECAREFVRSCLSKSGMSEHARNVLVIHRVSYSDLESFKDILIAIEHIFPIFRCETVEIVTEKRECDCLVDLLEGNRWLSMKLAGMDYTIFFKFYDEEK